MRYRFADAEFDEVDGTLRVAGKPVVVEPRPLRLLQELLRHVNEVVTKEELLDSVWEGRPTVDHVLANAVSKLRAALGEAGAARLVTVPRVGYRLTGPVQRVAARAPEVVLTAGQPVPGRDGYRLERALGEGAHSDVWLARHAKLGQAHVFKFASDGPRLSALKREYTLYRVLAQELGPRDDFARVLDTNFVVAPYFIECAFGGQSLLEWADTGGRLAQLPLQARLDLFVQIAGAVAAAHSVGVLHKDLKPGNVLVQTDDDGDGANPSAAVAHRPWRARLTDFGSGRLLDPARLEGLQLTALGMTQAQAAGTDSRTGTPMYMAPELMAGQAPTVQSDVYALGVLLWQLLVGDLRRPLATGWQREVEDDLLRDDITAATEGRPAARLGSASELVERLGGLDARRAARQRREEEAVRVALAMAELQRGNARRPWVRAALFCLALGLLASLYFQSRMQSALHEAREASARSRAISNFLAGDLLRIADAYRDGSSRPTTVMELVLQARVNLPETFKGQPRTEAEIRHHLGRALERLTSYGPASRQYEVAMQLLADRVPDDDPELLTLRLESVLLHLLLGEWADADRHYGLADAALAKAPPAPGSDMAVLQARAQVGMALQRQHLDEALSAARRLVQWADAQQGPDRAAWIEAQLQLGLVAAGRDDAAAFDAVLASLDAPGTGDQPASVAAATRLLLRRAVLVFDAGRPGAAEADLQSALQRLQKAPQPSLFQLALVQQVLADLYAQTGRLDQAAAVYAASKASTIAAVGEDHPQAFEVTEMRASVNMQRCDFKAAIADLRSVDTFVAKRANWPATARHATALAMAMLQDGRPAEVLKPLETLLARPDIAGDRRPAIQANLLVAQSLHVMSLAALGQPGPHVTAVQQARERIRELGVPKDGDRLDDDVRYIDAWLAAPDHKPHCVRPDAPALAAVAASGAPSRR